MSLDAYVQCNNSNSGYAKITVNSHCSIPPGFRYEIEYSSHICSIVTFLEVPLFVERSIFFKRF